jgi:hypothetical protein
MLFFPQNVTVNTHTYIYVHYVHGGITLYIWTITFNIQICRFRVSSQKTLFWNGQTLQIVPRNKKICKHYTKNVHVVKGDIFSLFNVTTLINKEKNTSISTFKSQ